jgi:hypothetical protein
MMRQTHHEENAKVSAVKDAAETPQEGRQDCKGYK